MKPNKKKVGQRIHKVRTSKDMTMEEFGSLIDSSPKSTVNNWEKGNNLPSKKKLEKIALIGGITTDWLKYGDLNEYISDLLKDKFDETIYPKDTVLKNFIPMMDARGLRYNDDLQILTLFNSYISNLERANFFPQDQIQAKLTLKSQFNEKIEADSMLTNSFTVIENLIQDTAIGMDGLLKKSFNDNKIKLYIEMIYLTRCLIQETEPSSNTEDSFNDWLLSVNDVTLLQYNKDKQKEWTDSIYNKDNYNFTIEDKKKIIEMIQEILMTL